MLAAGEHRYVDLMKDERNRRIASSEIDNTYGIMESYKLNGQSGTTKWWADDHQIVMQFIVSHEDSRDRVVLARFGAQSVKFLPGAKIVSDTLVQFARGPIALGQKEVMDAIWDAKGRLWPTPDQTQPGR